MENQIKAGAALNYVIIGINALVGLLYTPYMLRMLGQNEYGLFSLVASVISYLTILDFGFGNAIVRYTAKFRTENKTTEQYEMFGMFLKLFCAIGLFALCIGIILCFNVDNLFDKSMSPEELSKAKILLLILLINLALTFPLSVYGSIINAYENFIFQKLAQIARIVLSTIVMIVILRLGYKAIGLVVVQTIFNIAFLFGNAFYCRHKLKIKIVFGKMNWNFFREILFLDFSCGYNRTVLLELGTMGIRNLSRDNNGSDFFVSHSIKGNVLSVFFGHKFSIPSKGYTDGYFQYHCQRNIGFIHKNRTNPICGNIVHYSGFCDIRKIIYNPLGR